VQLYQRSVVTCGAENSAALFLPGIPKPKNILVVREGALEVGHLQPYTSQSGFLR
jgi:hypothetical protein